jgi:hypothetical protein
MRARLWCFLFGHRWDYHDLARTVRLCFRCALTERERDR